MAYTRIHPITRTLNKALDYIENPEKTQDYLYISAYNCTAEYASLDFAMTAELAASVKGNYDRTGGNNVLAHHMIQSFSPYDQITPEQAHEIGKKWADEILQGRYEYVITTHLDKGHIHNHVIFNATSFYDFHKFKNYKIAAHLREVSDRICEENGLTTIKNPDQKRSPSKYEMHHRAAGTSWKAFVQERIDHAIQVTNDYDSFREELLKDGIEILEGQRITFHKIGVESKNGRAAKVRGDRLGMDYTRERIMERLKDPEKGTRPIQNSPSNPSPVRSERTMPYDRQIHEKIQALSGRSRLAASAKDLAAALMTIRQETISGYSDFSVRITELQDKSAGVHDLIQQIDQKNLQYKNAAKYLITYNKIFPIYKELQHQSGINKSRFEKKYHGELAEFKYAAEQLEKMGVNPAVDPNKVLSLIQDQDKQASELSGDIKKIDQRITDIRRAQDIVEQLQKSGKEGYETKKETEQQGHSAEQKNAGKGKEEI